MSKKLNNKQRNKRNLSVLIYKTIIKRNKDSKALNL